MSTNPTAGAKSPIKPIDWFNWVGYKPFESRHLPNFPLRGEIRGAVIK